MDARERRGDHQEDRGSYARLFKPAPIVPTEDRQRTARSRQSPSDFKQYLGWPELFKRNGPLEKVLKESEKPKLE